MADDAIKEIEGLLAAEVERERMANARSMKIGVAVVGIVAAYLIYVSFAVSTVLDPKGLAEAASGFAIGAVPEASKEIRLLVVDGAPDLAKLGTQQVVDMVPMYREALQGEIDPVLDEVCTVLAQGAVKKMAEQSGNPDAIYTDGMALQAAADAAVARLDTVLDESMEVPDDEGVTPRQKIERSLAQLEKIDKELKLLEKKRGNPAERELLMAWLSVLGQHADMEDAVLAEEYRQGKRVPE